MRIALAQVGSIPGAFDATVEHMLAVAGQAARQGADLVLFPVTVLGGAYPTGLAEHAAFGLAQLSAVSTFAARTPVAAVVPVYVAEDGMGYTEMFLCAEGMACPLRRRAALAPDAASPDAAGAPAECCVGGVNVRLMAGDAGVTPLEPGCDVAVALSPLPYCYEDTSTLGVYGVASGMFAPIAYERPCWFVLLQGVGAYDDVVLAGGSFAGSPDGVVAASCPLFEEGVALFDVEPAVDADPAAAGTASAPAGEKPACEGGALAGVPLADVATPSEDDCLGYLWRALVCSVRDYVRKSRFADVVLGLSGGIDSSVVAALAVDALGPEHVLGVLMPGPYSSASSVDDAAELAARLDVATRTVPIKALFDAACPLFEAALGEPFAGVARENLQARLRGTVLMTVSNATGALVLNTGNKSEAGMGYSTLYGDTVGAFAPLSDVYKGRVYDLARWRNSRGPLPVIPQSVLDKPPSAELSEGQTDEGSFGATYPQIDAILGMHVDRGLDAQDIVNVGYAPETVLRVLSSCKNAEYKRRQEPMGPVVSLRPFADRAWPVVNGWRDAAAEPDPDAGLYAGGCDGGCMDDGFGADEADALAAGDDAVADALDAMLAAVAQQERAVGTVGDVVFGALVSGRGADMDSCMGLPLFSKN